MDIPRLQIRHQVHQTLVATVKAVKLPNDQGVFLLDMRQGFLEPRTSISGTGSPRRSNTC
jgi:hypothetical protein